MYPEIVAMISAKVTPAYAHSFSSGTPGMISTTAATGFTIPRMIRRYCGYPALAESGHDLVAAGEVAQ